jgi:hypothetical protein
MMEVIGFCASHYGIQMAVPAGQSPAGLLAAVLVRAKITYGWIGQQPGSGFINRPREPLGVFASLGRF